LINQLICSPQSAINYDWRKQRGIFLIVNCTIGVNRHLYMLPDRRSKKERLLKGRFIPVMHRWYPLLPTPPGPAETHVD
jgi:hypothetical protein